MNKDKCSRKDCSAPAKYKYYVEAECWCCTDVPPALAILSVKTCEACKEKVKLKDFQTMLVLVARKLLTFDHILDTATLKLVARPIDDVSYEEEIKTIYARNTGGVKIDVHGNVMERIKQNKTH